MTHDLSTRKGLLADLWDRARPALQEALPDHEVRILHKILTEAGKDDRFMASIMEQYRAVKLLEQARAEIARLKERLAAMEDSHL